ncbi:hypothetical protein D9613_006144 [Agrocybe pediades]|uniref:ABM domain-containing protein n=1 Tax=Agrocybe pediades TaxID=84607 RepID=A0A8H4QWU4_9AGAR|nr:hypothetical protein D9613_006144 [Agrocybe pediades]
MGSGIHLGIFKEGVMEESILCIHTHHPPTFSRSDTPTTSPSSLKMHVIELFSFSASTALLGDPSLATPTLQYFRNIEGCLDVRYGYVIEQLEKNRFMIVITWKTYEHFEQSLKGVDYNSFISSLRTSLPSSLEIQVSLLEEDPTEMLSAPVTDLSVVDVEPGTSDEAVKAVFQHMDESRHKVKAVNDPTAKYPTKIVYGPIKNSSEPQCLLLCGWSSREKHREYVKKATGVNEEELDVKKIITVVKDLHIRHAALKSA